MAIKQRALMKLDTAKNHVMRAMGAGSKAALGEVCRELAEIRDLYRGGLPKRAYAAYGEVCDGLILAVRKMMEDGEANLQQDAFALCRELLEYLETETAKEAHFKKEIFFLPYQSSMWDSLESVWKAAYEDKEHCNAYVMPIPYADLNPDRSVAAWHCERDQFPKYVPTLDWQEIDLKAWHPDAIFYHNPYDDCNLVTSVESRYYSRSLKECADKLVYIPYFVLGEPCTEEGVEHFVTTPGVLNADKVIVQSEAMRELYINILTKRTNHADRSFWEKRISGAGSPKIEKVLTSKKEDFDMPEKWRKLVEGKKVILYNTSLSAMLQNSDKVCDKLRYVFDVFRNRDDVVLWWRPHPLMKATFHSMRPQFEEEYLGLEKQYIEEGWGIYDDSSDLHRAICWSDVYYGDGSSVLNLYRATGKKIWRLDSSSAKNDLHVNVITHVAVSENFAWLIDGNVGIMFQLNFQERRLLPLEYIGIGANYSAIGTVQNDLIIAPCLSDCPFLAYNMERKEIRTLSIEKSYAGKKNPHMVHNCIEHKGKTYFLGWGYPFILEFDQKTRRHRIYDEIASLVRPYVKEEEFIHIFIQGIFVEDSLYLPLTDTNIIVEFDTETKKFTLHAVGKETNQYLNIAYDGMNIWLSQRIPGAPVLRWNLRTEDITEYGRYPMGCDFSDCREGYSGFINMVSVEGSILLFPDMANMVVEIDQQTGEMKKNVWLTSLMKEKFFYDYHGLYNHFRFVAKVENAVYAVLNDDHTLLRINYSEKTAERYPLTMKMADFLDWKPERDYGGTKKNGNERICGENIYRSICFASSVG